MALASFEDFWVSEILELLSTLLIKLDHGAFEHLGKRFIAWTVYTTLKTKTVPLEDMSPLPCTTFNLELLPSLLPFVFCHFALSLNSWPSAKPSSIPFRISMPLLCFGTLLPLSEFRLHS